MKRYIPKPLLQNTPSRKDGVTEEYEMDIRLASVHFIRKLGHELGFPYYTISTATIYFHYFFTFYSVKIYSYLDVAITCILVASKTEETYRKIKQILMTACKILNPHFAGFDTDDNKELENHRTKVAEYERVLLDAIRFDFHVIHPHRYMLKYICILYGKTNDVIAKAAWKVLEEFYCIPLCLQYPPGHLAWAAIIFSILQSESLPCILRWSDNSFINFHVPNMNDKPIILYIRDTICPREHIHLHQLIDICQQWIHNKK